MDREYVQPIMEQKNGWTPEVGDTAWSFNKAMMLREVKIVGKKLCSSWKKFEWLPREDRARGVSKYEYHIVGYKDSEGRGLDDWTGIFGLYQSAQDAIADIKVSDLAGVSYTAVISLEKVSIEFHEVDAVPTTWFGDIDGNIFVVISRDSEGFAWVVSDTRIPGDCEVLKGHERTLIEAKDTSSMAARTYNKSKNDGKDN